jgi:hypothetical protein
VITELCFRIIQIARRQIYDRDIDIRPTRQSSAPAAEKCHHADQECERFHLSLPNVKDEPRPWLARLVLLGARGVTAMVVGSGALLGFFSSALPLRQEGDNSRRDEDETEAERERISRMPRIKQTAPQNESSTHQDQKPRQISYLLLRRSRA